MTRPCHSLILAVLAAPLLFLAACKEGKVAPGLDTSEQAQTARVSVITVQPKDVTVFDELPGRVSAFRTAEIRSQVSGIVQKRLFVEGAEVESDQPLFQIDPAVPAADVETAAAIVARTQAELINAQSKLGRAQALAATHTVSPAALGDARAAFAQAKASVAEAKANLARRRLELSFATVRSPISGRIGQALISEGGLVSATATTALAVVQQIDRVYVDVRQPAMRRELLEDMVSAGKTGDATNVPVQIFTLSGKAFDQSGRLLFSDISVDTGTGSVGVRVEVANARRQLLPGMYIRVKVPRSSTPDALMVPQEAIQRDQAGRPQLVVIAADNTGSRRDVELGALVDGQYVIVAGLAAGEKIVVLGQDRVRAGVALETVPYRLAGLVEKN